MIHSCSYYCHKPECIKEQRDELREKLFKRQWVGLTDEDVDLLEELYAPPIHPDFVNDADHCTELIRHVEAKLKEKNNG